MSHRQYSVQGNQIEKLNARLLSISFSKDEMDWKSVFLFETALSGVLLIAFCLLFKDDTKQA